MTTAQATARKIGPGPGSHSGVKVLYNDATRETQLRRWSQLTTQVCLHEAQQLRIEIDRMLAHLAPEERPPVPSVHVLALVLGFFRTGAMLKQDAMDVMELSVKDMARLLCMGVSQLKAALAWLGCGDIKRHKRVVARGLGIITNAKRFGRIVRDGVGQVVYRTSKRMLSEAGQRLLGVCASRAKPAMQCARETVRALRRERRKTDLAQTLAIVGDIVSRFLHGATEPAGAAAEPPSDVLEVTGVELEVLQLAERCKAKRAKLAAE